MEGKNESAALIGALETINRTPEAARLHEAATDIHDSKAVNYLRDLVNGDFARLDVGQAEAVHGEVAVATAAPDKKELTPEKIERAVSLLKDRFVDPKNKKLCPELPWEKAEKALRATPEALKTVLKAEANGHEPTICFFDETGFDIATCSDETPQSTRDCVYDEEAEQWWRENRPNERFNGNAVSHAREMGWALQEVGLAKHIASNTPPYVEQGVSWFKTDSKTREAGYALLGDRGGVPVYVNQDNASNRCDNLGWRGSLRVNFVA